MSGPRETLVRRARPFDAAAIANVHVEAWRTTYAGLIPQAIIDWFDLGYRLPFWKDALSGQTFPIVYVAACEADIVGFASAGPNRVAGSAFDGEVYAIYVLQAHQRRGLGRQLLEATRDALGGSGFGSMILWVLAQSPACRFYEHLGGAVVDRRQEERHGEVFEEVAYGWHELGRSGAGT